MFNEVVMLDIVLLDYWINKLYKLYGYLLFGL